MIDRSPARPVRRSMPSARATDPITRPR